MRYVGGHVSISGGIGNAILNTKNIGGNCLQIFAGSPRVWYRQQFSSSDINTFKEGIKENNFGPVFIHALYLVNLASENPGLLEKSVKSLIIDLTNGSSINSSGVIVHIGSHLGKGFDSVKDQLVSVIKNILKETSDCDLLLENSAGQKGKIGNLNELSYLIKEIKSDRLKICLDTAHLFASGFNLKSANDIDELSNSLKKLDILDKVTCLHLNDSASDLGSGRDLHANIGEGKIGLEGLSNVINHQSFSHLPLILEVPGDNKNGPDLKNISLVKGILK